MARPGFTSVDAYIAAQPEVQQRALKRVRGAILKALPDVEQVISYQIPACRLNGRIVLYFAAWKAHYSLYPSTARLVAAFKDDLARYEVAKGTIRFPLSEPVPVRLIADIARFRAKEFVERTKAKGLTSRPRAARTRTAKRPT